MEPPDGVVAILLLEAVVEGRARVERLTKPLINVLQSACCLFGSSNYDSEDR